MERRAAAILMCAVLASCSGAVPAAPGSASPGATLAPSSLPTSSPTGGTPTPSASKRADIFVTAVGDSIPYGREDCGGCDTFPDLFGTWIASTTGMTVDVANMSQHDNNTAARMAVELPGEPAIEKRLADSDVIIVTIGHNDTPWNATDDSCDADHGFFDGNPKASWSVLVGPCLKTEVDRYRKNLTTIFDEIVRLRAGKPTAYRFTTHYSDVAGDPCCPAEATKVAATVKEAFNGAACDVAKTKGFVCVDVFHAFNGAKGTESAGDLLAPDHTHPSADGQRKIAELLEAAGLAPIR